MSNILGIDIGQNTAKIVSISKENDKYFLDFVGEAKTPKLSQPTDNSIKLLSEIEPVIKSLLNDSKIKSKQVVASLPEDEVISRLVRLPPLKDSEIMDALKFEAETFIPYPLDEVSIDYEIIEKDDAGRLSIFVIAAKNDLIQSYIKLFKNLGLELLALESPAIALRRSFKLNLPTVTRLLAVDMGEKFSNIFSINNGNVYFSRSLEVGGESLTRAISLSLGLDMPSAEEYKKAYGIKETELEGKIRLAVMPVLNNIVEEIRKTISLFIEDVGKQPEILVLGGGGAGLPGMAEELTKILGIEVQVLQPFLSIDSTRFTPNFNLNTDGYKYGLSVGLALRGIL